MSYDNATYKHRPSNRFARRGLKSAIANLDTPPVLVKRGYREVGEELSTKPLLSASEDLFTAEEYQAWLASWQQ